MVQKGLRTFPMKELSSMIVSCPFYEQKMRLSSILSHQMDFWVQFLTLKWSCVMVPCYSTRFGLYLAVSKKPDMSADTPVRGQGCPQTGVSAGRGVRRHPISICIQLYRPGRGALFFPNEKNTKKQKQKHLLHILQATYYYISFGSC